jgi:DNA-binding GntR family transcriptional regulator
MQTTGAGPSSGREKAPSSGREKAYAFIVDQVLTLPTTTGSFLNEQELAAQIGVSRTPVREALLLLQAEGLVEMVPKRGARVPALSGRQIAELMDLRGVLERHAAARVLSAGNAPVAAMRTILAEQEALVDSADETSAKTFIALDGRFHQALVDAAQSELLATTYTGLRARLSRIGLAAIFASPNRQRPVCAEHGAIVDALASGDVAQAEAKIDEHLDITLQILLRA